MARAESQNLWCEALERLPSKQKEILPLDVTEAQEFSGHALLDTVEYSQKLASKHSRTILTPQGPVVIKEKLDRIAVWIHRFIAVGDAAVQYDPGHAAIPWAVFRLVLQVFLNDGETASEFAIGLEQVAFLVYDCRVRESLYLDGINNDIDDLRRHLVSLYEGILVFLIQAWVFFQSGTAKRILRSIGQNGKDVIALLVPVGRQTEQLLTICGRIDAERQLDLRKSVNKLVEYNEDSVGWLRKRLDENEDTMDDFLRASHQETLNRLDTIDMSLSKLLNRSQISSKQMPTPLRHAVGAVTASNAFRGQYTTYDRLKVLDWLSKIPYSQHHVQIHGKMLAGTGKWFFERQAYRNWLDDVNTALLWFHGAAGQGKTKIMSLVVEQALIKTQKVPHPLFFYCSRTPGEPERARAEDILRCLVKQITLKHEEQEGRFPRYVVKEYKDTEKRGFVINKLPADRCCEIIAKYVKDYSHIFICIDAVDECSSTERYELFTAFQRIVTLASTVGVKILVSSRDDVDFETFLPGHRVYQIGVSDALNRDDIAMYVETEVSQLIRQRRISVKGKPPSENLHALITQKLRDGAQGMFRWVSLQLEYLCTLKTAGDIKQRVGRLPKELTMSYDELYNRKLNLYDTEDKDRLFIALTMILWDKEKISDLLFAHIVFFDPQDDNTVSESSDSELNGKGPSADNEIITNVQLDEEQNPLVREIVRLCFNLIVHDATTSVFRFAHTSVQDYLQTHRIEFAAKDRSFARLAEHSLRMLLRTDLPLCHDFVQKRSSESQQVSENQSYADAYVTLERSHLVGSSSGTLISTYIKGPPKSMDSRVTTARVVLYFEENMPFYLNKAGPKIRDTSPIRELLQEFIDSESRATWTEIRPYIFLEACEYGDTALMASLLEAHPALINIEEVFPLRREPLTQAVICGRKEVIEYLIGKGASLNTDIFMGTTALSVAALNGYVDMMRLLIERGADVEGGGGPSSTELLDVNPNGEPFEHPYPQIEATAGSGITPLACAVSGGNVEATEFLIQNGANVHVTTCYGPLIGMTPNDQQGEYITHLLLAAGANINAVSYKGESPLILAAQCHKAKQVRLFLDAGADLETRSIDGKTALMHASMQREGSDCAKALLAAGADPNVLSLLGAGLLSYTASSGSVEALALILPHVRDLNTQDWEGDTPLCEAVFGNHTEAVKMLLKAGAEITPLAPGPHCPFLPEEKRMAHYGRDAILRAAEWKRFDIIRVLIEARNQRDPGGEYAEAATLLEDGDQGALERWIQKRHDMSPRKGPRFEEMRKEMHERVAKIEYEEFEKNVTAAGRKILFYKHPMIA